MNFSTIILGIVLIFFIVLFILLMVYVSQINREKKRSKGVSARMPPLDYMRQIGSLCPDYWVYMGKDPAKKGYHLCHNKFNVPLANPDNKMCYSDKSGRIMSFKDPDMDANGKINKEAEKMMCEFVTNCGESEGITASWLGIGPDQMSPRYVDCGRI